MEMKEVRSAPPSDYQELQFNRDQHTVVTIGNPVEHPRDYVVWSICSLFHGNPLCFGLLALIFSIKARDMKVNGDLQRARGYSKWALVFNGAALIIFSLIILSFLIILSIRVISFGPYFYRY
ncbi:dispanin subfamily A member 2b-like [Gadus chalcogrammus]|uniref:dispanin subfamily A member 2b-like n=1 Tax=Gadus chalcogrammus TaxID=1042646 RepID=UPI0024C48573|nr:dispanin subfamily A member 2b-like [Gadus chalcogrammus]